MFELITIMPQLDSKDVNFVSLSGNIYTATSADKMILMLFSMITEYELNIKERGR